MEGLTSGTRTSEQEKQGRLIVIGLGHRARQGKDITASFIKKMHPNVHIIHFADGVYNEVRNQHGIETNKPLVVLKDQYAFFLNDIYDVDGQYILFNGDRDRHSGQISRLYEILENGKKLNPENTSTIYWGMTEKDAPMLQFWGTEFRRYQDTQYWANQAKQAIHRIWNSREHEDDDVIVLIPDLRFQNELHLIQSYENGYYIKLVRLNEDGSQFIDPSRPHDHPSEISLEGIDPHFEIRAYSGDILHIHTATQQIMERIL